MYGMLHAPQHGELQSFKRILHDALGHLERAAVHPFSLHEVKSDLVTFRWCVYPGPQATTADKFIGFLFEKGPVLNAVFLLAPHFSQHLFPHFFIAERSAEKRHDVGVTPKTSGVIKVTFLPGAEEQSVSA